MGEMTEKLDERTAEAQALVGKTISVAMVLQSHPDYDDANILHLAFSDGTAVDIWGGYSGYSGASQGEFQETITVGTMQP